jgi:hypothetical protein
MRIIDAYRRGIISREQYITYLEAKLDPEGPFNPSTTLGCNPWVEILDWDTTDLGSKNIVVKNLDLDNDLTCKVEVYVEDILSRVEYDTFLDTFNVIIEDPCTSIVVSVRSSKYGSGASYDFSYKSDSLLPYGASTSSNQVMAYKGQYRTISTVISEEITIPVGSKRAIISCNHNTEAYIDFNRDASMTSPMYIEFSLGLIEIDLLSVTKLSAYVVVGNIGVVFFG